MPKATDNFIVNFKSAANRMNFKNITGIKVEDDLDAYIGFINALMIDNAFSAMQRAYAAVPDKYKRE